MKTIELGKSGIMISEMGYGCMMFGAKLDEAQSHRQLDSYIAAGGNMLDTANIYGRKKDDTSSYAGRSEEIVGSWIKSRNNRDKIILASKVGFPYADVKYGTTAVQIKEECEKTLKKLQTDYLDLYYLHTDDTETPMEETFQALDSLVKQGKVRAIGASNFSAWRLERAKNLCQANNWAQICCIQQRYSYLRPKQDSVFTGQKYVVNDLREYIRDTDITLLAYCPLLKGAYVNPEKSFMEQYIGKDSDKRLLALEEVSDETGYTKIQLVYYWLMNQNPKAVPLVTTTSDKQFNEAMGTLNVKLTYEQMQKLTFAGE